MAALTPEQQARARRAIAGGRGCGDTWAEGGPLSQIATAEGVTPAELARWDSVANGDGHLTVRRIKESGNAFAGWPLSFLEALEAAWKGSGGDADVALAALHRWFAPPDEPEAVMAGGTYEGPERRNAFTVAIDIKSLLMLIALIGPLVAVITMVLQVRQDVRGNSIRVMQVEADVKSLQARMAEAEKAKLLYCSGRREAAERDTNGALRIPDAGC